MNALVLNTNEGRVVSLGTIRMIVKEDGTRTRGTLAIAEFEIAPHVPTPPPHIHRAHEECFYILEGELEFLVDTEKIHAGTGAYVTVPIGVPHTFANTGNAPARFLNTFTPPKYLNYFYELSALLSTSGIPTPVQMGELMARYDTEVVGMVSGKK
ncbi:MAG: cupin domain-containing protein [Ktedonobacteraceae bacterium]